jgi:hypothetical protein
MDAGAALAYNALVIIAAEGGKPAVSQLMRKEERMNVFNRIAMIILILGLLVGVAYFTVRPLSVIATVETNLSYFKEAIPTDQYFFMFLLTNVLLLLILVILLWMELRRPRYRTVRIKNTGAGDARLSVESVAQSLEYRVDELPGVRKVQPRVTSRGRDVDISLVLNTSPSVNVPELSAQIADLCREIVETQLGLRLHGKVAIKILHEPYPRGTMPVSAPLPKVSAPSRPAALPVSLTRDVPAPESLPLKRPEPLASGGESKSAPAAPTSGTPTKEK